jgi:hypothetical protein
MSNHREKWQPEFEKFDRQNPHIYRELLEKAKYVKGRGMECSIYLLIERVRWFFNFEVTRDPAAGEFKINNNHSPFYARKLMKEPGFEGFFAIRDKQPEDHKPRHAHVDIQTIELPDEEGL